MRADTVKNSAGVTVHTVNPVHQRGPVFYASQVRPDRESCKAFLVSTLWDHLAAAGSPYWKGFQSSSKAAFPLQVLRDTLGRPYCMVGDCQGPAISFSERGGTVWAALCGDETAIGIDVAGADEFSGNYPLQRVFQQEELEYALNLAGGNLEQAAALLWSIKEAVVKALGCGFHLVDPLHITVYPSPGEVSGNGGHTFPVGLSGKARMRFPLVACRSLWVHSLPVGKNWLSVALLDRSLTGNA